jgi:hypothetical protein
MYKFYGLKVKRVCSWCFQEKIKYNPRIDALRQTGMIRHIKFENKSKSRERIGAWFYMFERLMKKNRLSDCIVR